MFLSSPAESPTKYVPEPPKMTQSGSKPPNKPPSTQVIRSEPSKLTPAIISLPSAKLELLETLSSLPQPAQSKSKRERHSDIFIEILSDAEENAQDDSDFSDPSNDPGNVVIKLF